MVKFSEWSDALVLWVKEKCQSRVLVLKYAHTKRANCVAVFGAQICVWHLKLPWVNYGFCSSEMHISCCIIGWLHSTESQTHTYHFSDFKRNKMFVLLVQSIQESCVFFLLQFFFLNAALFLDVVDHDWKSRGCILLVFTSSSILVYISSNIHHCIFNV